MLKEVFLNPKLFNFREKMRFLRDFLPSLHSLLLKLRPSGYRPALFPTIVPTSELSRIIWRKSMKKILLCTAFLPLPSPLLLTGTFQICN